MSTGSSNSDPVLREHLEDHVARNHHAYESGVLRPEVHYRLVEKIDEFASRAGIDPSWVWTPLSSVVGPDEVAYFRAFRKTDARGLVYYGTFDPPVWRRMGALAGAFMRNFVSVRVVPMEGIVDETMDGEWAPDFDVLMVPDFCPDGLKANDARRRIAFAMLMDRMNRGRHTLLACSDGSALERAYGSEVVAVVADALFPIHAR